jgi:Prolipoprotein diacylglyceryl transferase
VAAPAVQWPFAPATAFRALGVVGLVASVLVALTVADVLGVDLRVQAAIVVVGVLTFLALALEAMRRTGRESLTYYHHEIAILGVAAGFTALVGAPVLAHLDATALGISAFLVLGRLGCLSAGCCHGRVARRGVRYGERHVRAGFPRYLKGLALIPVQAVEAVATAAIVTLGAIVALDPEEPGRALGFCVSAYAVVRFALEELRGDPLRRYVLGLSEAQWTSLALLACGLVAVAAGVLPSAGVEPIALGAIALEAGLVAARRRRPVELLDPRHVREVAALAKFLHDQPVRPAGPIAVWSTSAGLRVSSARAGAIWHVTLSRVLPPLEQSDAERLGQVIGLVSAAPPIDVLAAPLDTFHVLLPARMTREAP